MSELVAYVDGGSLGNPGPSGIGVVIDGCESGPIRIAKWIGHQDNNVAEYVALLEALQCALSLKAKTLHVYSDSEVVVRQMRGEYICRSSRLYSLHWTCRKLARALKFLHLACSARRQCRSQPAGEYRGEGAGWVGSFYSALAFITNFQMLTAGILTRSPLRCRLPVQHPEN